MENIVKSVASLFILFVLTKVYMNIANRLGKGIVGFFLDLWGKIRSH